MLLVSFFVHDTPIAWYLITFKCSCFSSKHAHHRLHPRSLVQLVGGQSLKLFLSLPVVKCQLWPHVNISHLSFGVVALSATQTHPLSAQHLGYLVHPVRRCCCLFIYKRQMSVFPSCNKAMVHGILRPGTRPTSCTSIADPKLLGL